MHLVKISGTPGKTETSTWFPNTIHTILIVNKESEIRNIGSAITSPDPQPAPAGEEETATLPDDEREAALRAAITGECSGVNPSKEDILVSEVPGYEAHRRGLRVR